MTWLVITILAGWGLWVWRQRNAFRLRAYLLEQKYIHGRAVDAAMTAQLASDRFDLAAIGDVPWATDLLGRRETSHVLERQVQALQTAHVGGVGPGTRHPLFEPYSRGPSHALPSGSLGE